MLAPLFLILVACGDPKPLTVVEYAEQCAARVSAVGEGFDVDSVTTWGEVQEFMNAWHDALASLEPPKVLARFHAESVGQADLWRLLVGDKDPDAAYSESAMFWRCPDGSSGRTGGQRRLSGTPT